MKRVVFFIALIFIYFSSFSQSENPHFLSINAYPTIDNIGNLKLGFGYMLDGAYFFNDWFGVGGKASHSMFKYSEDGIKANSFAQHIGLTANVFIYKEFAGGDFAIMPNIGVGASYTILPNLVTDEFDPTMQFYDRTTNIVSPLFNAFGIKAFWNFHEDMAVNVSIDYNMAVSKKWPDKTFGEFLYFSVGYTYFLNFGGGDK